MIRIRYAALVLLALAATAQAQVVPISSLPSGTTLAGTEPIPAVQSGHTVKITPNQIITLAGSTFQAKDPQLDGFAALSPSANQCDYWTGSTALALYNCTSFSRGLMNSADAPTWRSALGVSGLGGDATYAFRANNLSDLASASTARTNLGLGTISTQSAATVAITGGSITGITDLALADGGTGASTAALARTNLGVVIGTNVQAWDADLDALGALTGTSTIYYRSAANTWSAVTTSSGVTFTSGALGLGAVTPTSVAASGTVTGSNLSGTNTGDQTTITGNAGTATKWATARNLSLTGDLTGTLSSVDGSAAVSGATTLATVNSNVGSFGSGTSIPNFTVNAKGLVTAAGATTLTAGAISSSYVPCKSAVAVSHTGDTTETTLATCTLPGNALGTNGQVEIMVLVSWTNNANTKTLRVKFGAMVLQNTGLSGNASQQVLLRVANRNSAASQVAFPSSPSGLGSGGAVAPTTGTVDTTANVDITITGQLGVGTDTMTLESYIMRVTPG